MAGALLNSAIYFALLLLPLQSKSLPSIAVTGDVQRSLTLTAQELGTMPRQKVTFRTNGIETVYEGVWLSEILKRAGVPLGADLRGPALATYILVSASDDYSVVFSIGE